MAKRLVKRLVKLPGCFEFVEFVEFVALDLQMEEQYG